MNKKRMAKKAIENSFWDFVSKIIDKAGAIVFTIILARFLLPEGFGVYSLALSVALIFTSFLDYSIGNTMIRYVSYALKDDKKNTAKSYFRYLFRIRLTLSFLSSLVLLFLAYPISVFVFKKPEIFMPLFVFGFYIFVLSMETFYDSLFYIFKKVKVRALKEIVRQLARIFLTLAVFFLVAKSYYVVGVIFGLILTSIVVLIFMLVFIKKFASFLFEKDGKGRIDKKRILKYLFYISFISVSGLIFMYIDTVMIGILVPDIRYVGLYNSSITLIWGITGMLSFATVFLPFFTQAKKKDLESIFNKIMRYYVILTIPIAFGIAILSKYILFIIYGGEYIEASLILTTLAFLVIEIINSGFISTLFSAREKLKPVAKIVILMIVMNIVLNFVFIKSLLGVSQLWATNGAAIATLISRYTYLILMIILMKKELNVQFKQVNWKKPLIASIIMFLALFSLNNFILKDMTLFLGVMEIILGIGIYFLVMFLIKGISKREIDELRSR